MIHSTFLCVQRPCCTNGI